MTVVCRGCGSAGFDSATGCKACGYGSNRADEPTLRIPTSRNALEREALFEKVVRYAIQTGDVSGSVRALVCGTVAVGSPIAIELLGTLQSKEAPKAL